MTEVNNSFREIVGNEPRLTYARLMNEYHFNKTACENLTHGKSMNFNIEMNFVRIDLLYYPTVSDRFHQLIHILDAQRKQDLELYGPEGTPFPKSLEEVLEDEVCRRLQHDLTYKSREEILEELEKKGYALQKNENSTYQPK